MKPVSRRHWMTLCAGAAGAASLTLSGPSRGLRAVAAAANAPLDRKSTRLNSSHT